MFKEYAEYDATGLAALVRRREIAPPELLDAAIARAEAVNPRLNAIITPMHDIARARAGQDLGGPFAGVPFLIKDLFQDYAGVATACGSRALKDAGWRPARHAEVVNRFLAAGLVVFGKTNTPELGAKGITEPEAWGAARNPWNTDHTPGGSSGGSAAAVAARIVPMAGANDGGGSIRIPAACCGLFGLKPGRGRVPTGPEHGELLHGAAVDHVLTRSVRDSAAMLDVLAGPDVGAPFHVAPPERPYLEEVGRAPGRLRIGFTARSPIGTEVHPDCAGAVADCARLLESLGHHVEEAVPQIDGLALARDFLTMWFAQLAAQVDLLRAQTGSGAGGFELDTRAMAALGRTLRANEYVAAHNRWNGFARALGDFHQRYDLLLTPTLALPPARIGEVATPAWQQAVLRVILALGLSRLLLASGMVDVMARENLRWVPFTQLANLTGVPAMSVPLGSGSAGLPVGVQFVAANGGEGLLFRLAAQLEQAAPWDGRRPAL
ncbi:MAG: amidase [Nevskia sp.]|nr:amidase [Nevskia sp.]